MSWLVLLLIAAVVVWFIYESAWDASLFSTEPGRACANLSATQSVEWLRQHPETQVLDVRSAREFSGGAVPGAVNISMGSDDFDQQVSALDRHKPVLVYCAGGYRSRKAVEKFKALGFENIQHMHRGYLGWRLVAN
ncbi:MAG: rhodanese-like domain-containing protein [Verrucomicrobiota bacterium]